MSASFLPQNLSSPITFDFAQFDFSNLSPGLGAAPPPPQAGATPANSTPSPSLASAPSSPSGGSDCSDPHVTTPPSFGADVKAFASAPMADVAKPQLPAFTPPQQQIAGEQQQFVPPPTNPFVVPSGLVNAWEAKDSLASFLPTTAPIPAMMGMGQVAPIFPFQTASGPGYAPPPYGGAYPSFPGYYTAGPYYPHPYSAYSAPYGVYGATAGYYSHPPASVVDMHGRSIPGSTPTLPAESFLPMDPTAPRRVSAAEARKQREKEKRFACPDCQRCFSRAFNLQTHVATHRGIKPFDCPAAGCEKSFSRRHDLGRHLNAVHENWLLAVGQSAQEAAAPVKKNPAAKAALAAASAELAAVGATTGKLTGKSETPTPSDHGHDREEEEEEEDPGVPTPVLPSLPTHFDPFGHSSSGSTSSLPAIEPEVQQDGFASAADFFASLGVAAAAVAARPGDQGGHNSKSSLM